MDYSGDDNNALSRVVSLIDSDATHLADYLYLGVDRRVQMTSAQPGTKFTYIKQGSEPNGNAGDQYIGLDRFYRVVDIRWLNSAGTDIERVKYGFDAASSRKWRENTVAGGGQDEFYTYDGLYQLTALDRGTLNGGKTGISGTPSWEEDLTFDPTGNWKTYVTKVSGAANLNQSRTHNKANELTQINGASTVVAEDLAGNMTRVPQVDDWSSAYDLTYDAWNRLAVVMEGSTVVAAYQYDGQFRRVTKESGGSTRHFYYSDAWQILEERVETSTTPDRQFVWGLRYIDDLILRDRFTTGTLNERLYCLQDYFQPTAVTNTSGLVQERYGYDAFGTSRVMTDLFASRSSSLYEWETRYGAYRWDSETGLYQVRYRYLHPTLGRWSTRDPIGYTDEYNFYSYVGNQPLVSVDYLGLQKFDVVCEKANDLDSRIKKLRTKSGDVFKKLFMDLQLCILRKLCEGACCESDFGANWLNKTIDTFMTQFTDALDGYFYSTNQDWRAVLEKIEGRKPLAPNSLLDSMFIAMGTPSGGNSLTLQATTIKLDRANAVFSAREMALTHINQDLALALKTHGPGLNSDWKCIGDVVGSCQDTYFDALEKFIGKKLPKDEFDIAHIRDAMRDKIQGDLHRPPKILK